MTPEIKSLIEKDRPYSASTQLNRYDNEGIIINNSIGVVFGNNSRREMVPLFLKCSRRLSIIREELLSSDKNFLDTEKGEGVGNFYWRIPTDGNTCRLYLGTEHLLESASEDRKLVDFIFRSTSPIELIEGLDREIVENYLSF